MGKHELFHERSIAQRVAGVRIALTLANFLIIFLDANVPLASGAESLVLALMAAGLFLAYAILAWASLRFRWVSFELYQYAVPVFDIGLTALLIVATDGYLSPFNLWYVFAVVATGFSRHRLLPLFTTVLGLGAQLYISKIPQYEPLNLSLFVVRTGYIFGVAAVVAFLSSYLARQSLALAAIERAGLRLSGSVTLQGTIDVLLDEIEDQIRPTGVRFEMIGAQPTERGRFRSRQKLNSWTGSLDMGLNRLGVVTLCRIEPFRTEDEFLLRVLCERASAAFQRVLLAEQYVEAALREERARFADQLHDSYLQTLAALDLKAETVKVLGAERVPELSRELGHLKDLTRKAAAEARALLDASPEAEGQGPAALEHLVRTRWRGKSVVEIEPDVRLSSESWRIVSLLVREGLNNAALHGKASRVQLHVGLPDGHVSVRLADDGCGIGKDVRMGYGLQRISDLISSRGGQVVLRSRQGEQGAELVATLPMEP